MSGCEDDKGSDGVSVDKYNTLVSKHNRLVAKNSGTKTSTWEASNAFVSYVKATEEMNESLDLFAGNVLIYIDLSASRKKAEYQKIRNQFKAGNTDILKVQNALITQFNELYDVAPDVYEKDTDYLDSLNMQSRRSKLLFGIEKQHQTLMAIVDRHFAMSGGQPQKTIVLTQVETKIGSASDGSGLLIDNSGTITTLTPKEFRRAAINKGFETSTIDDSQKMASTMNGVVGMACTNRDLVQVLSNLVSHMKTKANQNSDDLEIALAIDYSGSMSNNISQVLQELTVFVQSLENVKNAGRGVKIGITTFGNKGQEKINLDLTSDVGSVQQTLASLLNRFSSEQHSMSPGEASYYGLKKTADLSWNSRNRQTIVITDEPSYSLQRGDTQFVNSVIAKMSSINVYPLMVKLCN